MGSPVIAAADYVGMRQQYPCMVESFVTLSFYVRPLKSLTKNVLAWPPVISCHVV